MPPAAFLHPENAPKSLAPQTHCGSLQRSPRSFSWIKGPTSKGREGEEREGRGGTLDPHNVGDRLTLLIGE